MNNNQNGYPHQLPKPPPGLWDWYFTQYDRDQRRAAINQRVLDLERRLRRLEGRFDHGCQS